MPAKSVLYQTPTSEIINSFRIPGRTPYSADAILDSLEQVYRYVPLKSEAPRKQRLIRNLVDEWFAKKMGAAYEEISPKITDLEREITIDVSKQELVYRPYDTERRRPYGVTMTTVKIPFFLKASIHDETWEKVFSQNDRSDNYTFKLSAAVPKIPKDIRVQSKRALATPYEVYSEAMETRVLSDILLENAQYAPFPDSANLLIMWKPKLEDFKLTVERIDKDPFLALSWNRMYLVSTWNEPNEDPFLEELAVYKTLANENTTLEPFLENQGDRNDQNPN